MLKQACPELVSGFSMTVHFTGIIKPFRVAKTRLVELRQAQNDGGKRGRIDSKTSSE
jgi:hypothetical protein